MNSRYLSVSHTGVLMHASGLSKSLHVSFRRDILSVKLSFISYQYLKLINLSSSSGGEALVVNSCYFSVTLNQPVEK